MLKYIVALSRYCDCTFVRLNGLTVTITDFEWRRIYAVDGLRVVTERWVELCTHLQGETYEDPSSKKFEESRNTVE